MAPSCLSTLSTELIILVMSHLRRPRDLSALARTSMRNYHIFSKNKSAILEAAVRNTIPQIVLHDAIAACEASQVAKLRWSEAQHEDKESLFFRTQAAFIAQYRKGHDQQIRSDQGLLLSLYKLSFIVDEFMDDFRQKAFILASERMPLIRSESSDQLSFEEDTRLRRAFFRFEVYRKLFSNTVANIDMEEVDSSLETKQRFFSMFPAWEREELLSIQEYLVSWTKELYRHLQNYVVQTISIVAQKSLDRSHILGRPVEMESSLSLQCSIDLANIDVFQYVEYCTEGTFQYFAARGLPFLRWLLLLPPNDQVFTTFRHSIYRCKPSLFESVYQCRDYLQAFDNHALHENEIERPTLAQPNQGWRWGESQSLMQEVDGILQRYTLRQMGYVFWSAARLNRGWGLDKTEASQLALSKRDRFEDAPPKDHEPSFEERFGDIPVPKDLFHQYDSVGHLAFQVSEKMDSSEHDGDFPYPFSTREVELYDIEY